MRQTMLAPWGAALQHTGHALNERPRGRITNIYCAAIRANWRYAQRGQPCCHRGKDTLRTFAQSVRNVVARRSKASRLATAGLLMGQGARGLAGFRDRNAAAHHDQSATGAEMTIDPMLVESEPNQLTPSDPPTLAGATVAQSAGQVPPREPVSNQHRPLKPSFWQSSRRPNGVATLGAVVAQPSNRQLAFLIVPVVVYFVSIGYLLGSVAGAILGLVIAAAIVAVGVRVPAETMLALYRAEPLSPGQGASLREMVATLSTRAGLPTTPAIAIIPSLAVGAFAVGSSAKPAILVTEGLLRRHSLPQIAAITAHEIEHIRARDLPMFTLADTMTRVAQLMFYAGLIAGVVATFLWSVGEPTLQPWPVALLIAGPLLSSALQLALPRNHDLAADIAAVRLVGDHALVATVASSLRGCGSILDDVRLPVPQRRIPLPSPLRAHTDGAVRARKLTALAATLAQSPNELQPLQLSEGSLISLAGVGPGEMRPRDRWPGVWF